MKIEMGSIAHHRTIRLQFVGDDGPIMTMLVMILEIAVVDDPAAGAVD